MSENKIIRQGKFDFGSGNMGYRLEERSGELYLVLEDGAEIEFEVKKLIKEVHERGISPSWRVLTSISLAHEPLISIERMERVVATCYDGVHYTIYVVLGAVFSPLYYLYVLVSRAEPELSKALCS
ncbi:hypothetical protein [Pyrobaculum sp.]|uniref:hypothetical protein n=1 Tax=Pyrobaculum sp. TaxID=2004705 RepID=UPI003CB8C265